MVQADRRNSNKAEKKDELVEKLVHINRVAAPELCESNCAAHEITAVFLQHFFKFFG